MVEARLDLEPEVREIFDHIDENRNFLLSGGAGSGKTYSLVQVIRQALLENPTAKIACMTYTNAAVKEIEERVNHKNLIVSTIHDFLWDHIKHFKQELKAILIELLNNKDVTKISIDVPSPIPPDYYDGLEKGIQYKEYLRLKEGIISHDELLIVANLLFSRYKKLSDVMKDKYKFIFIDEYQDTSKSVVEIFLTHFKQSAKHNVIGFFGDAMQAIYDDGIGNLDEYKGDAVDLVAEVKKKQNRRNPSSIINIANLLRTDVLTQEPSTDEKAPNMYEGNVKEGTSLFIYSNNPDLNLVRQHLTQNEDWDFTDNKQTKELNLTHNLIAGKAGFRKLMDIYSRDQIIAYRNRVKDYIKANNINNDFSANTFGEVIEILKENKNEREQRPFLPTRGMQAFIDDNEALFQTALNYNYELFSKLFVSSDQLIDDKKQDESDENKKGSKRDNLIKHLFKIQNNIWLYQNRRFNEFLRVTDFRSSIVSIESKRILQRNIMELIEVGEKTIEEVINEAHEKGICRIDQKLEAFQSEKLYVYNQVKDVPFSEFQNLYKYLEGYTPFSTQHKTKGSEFNNVLVVLDNGNWNNYNFENLFLETGNETVLERSQKIFYVCCTRAKENLAVFYHNPAPEVINKAKEWFGEGNILNLS
ncbi:TPA: UvrD-helicase domain-containing protein [Elizabethkingia anophelis]